MDLFKLDIDNRVSNMRTFLRTKLYSNKYWKPSVKEILEISDNFKVTGGLTLEVFDNVAKEFCEFLKENLELMEIDEDTIFDTDILPMLKRWGF